MRREKMPVGFTVEHASSSFGGYQPRVALTPEQQRRFSDYDTFDTVPKTGSFIVAARLSRALGDLNRPPEHPQLFPLDDFAKPEPNDIWLPGNALTPTERRILKTRNYDEYHKRISGFVQGEFGAREGLLISWHNTDDRPGYTIGTNEAGEMQEMKPIILSNFGSEGMAYSTDERGETTTCAPDVLIDFTDNLRISLREHGLPNEVYWNLGYKGGYSVQQYNTFRNPELGIDHPLHAIQVEYGTGFTHFERDPAQPNDRGMQRIQAAFGEALHETAKSLGSADNF